MKLIDYFLRRSLKILGVNYHQNTLIKLPLDITTIKSLFILYVNLKKKRNNN